MKNYDILEAFETLVMEQCADPRQMVILADGLDQIKKQLNIHSIDLTRAIEDD